MKKSEVIHVRLDRKTKAALVQKAREEGRTLSGMVGRLLAMAVATKPGD